MSIIVISDLHLDEGSPKVCEKFFNFLHSPVFFSVKALYILGDFFEVWVGDDYCSPFIQAILDPLQALSLKIPIYFMRGNRDFLIGRRFLKASGCQLLPDEYVVDIYGTPTLMMHGDTLCIEDVKYLKFRKKTRKWWVQQLFLLKPLKQRLDLAKKYRAASAEHMQNLPDYIMDVTPAEVERMMLKHKVQHLIHGHTHRQAVHKFSVNNQELTRTVLGAWHDTGNALICKPNGENELINF